jgi:hypothetical protein
MPAPRLPRSNAVGTVSELRTEASARAVIQAGLPESRAQSWGRNGGVGIGWSPLCGSQPCMRPRHRISFGGEQHPSAWCPSGESLSPVPCNASPSS